MLGSNSKYPSHGKITNILQNRDRLSFHIFPNDCNQHLHCNLLSFFLRYEIVLQAHAVDARAPVMYSQRVLGSISETYLGLRFRNILHSLSARS